LIHTGVVGNLASRGKEDFYGVTDSTAMLLPWLWLDLIIQLLLGKSALANTLGSFLCIHW